MSVAQRTRIRGDGAWRKARMVALGAAGALLLGLPWPALARAEDTSAAQPVKGGTPPSGPAPFAMRPAFGPKRGWHVDAVEISALPVEPAGLGGGYLARGLSVRPEGDGREGRVWEGGALARVGLGGVFQAGVGLHRLQSGAGQTPLRMALQFGVGHHFGALDAGISLASISGGERDLALGTVTLPVCWRVSPELALELVPTALFVQAWDSDDQRRELIGGAISASGRALWQVSGDVAVAGGLRLSIVGKWDSFPIAPSLEAVHTLAIAPRVALDVGLRAALEPLLMPDLRSPLIVGAGLALYALP